MEFLRVLEDELRTVSAEAKKKFPAVKDAAERATLALRGMREKYAAAVRQMSGEDTPPLSMFQSPAIVHPFLLACNDVSAGHRLVGLALGAIQLLMTRDAMDPAELPNLFRMLTIQVKSSESTTQLKVLQTTLHAVTWRPMSLNEENCAESLCICFELYHSQHAAVGNAASATVRQILSLLFDRVPEEPVPGKGTLGRCAALAFQDLCLLSSGKSSAWLKRIRVPDSLGMELIEQILATNHKVFHDVAPFQDLVSNEVAPLLEKTLRAEITFPICVRLMRTFATVMTHYGQEILFPQLEVLLSLVLHTLSGYAQQMHPSDGKHEETSRSGMYVRRTSQSGFLGTGMELSLGLDMLTGELSAAMTDAFSDRNVSPIPGQASSHTSPSCAAAAPAWAAVLGLEALHCFCILPKLVEGAFKTYDFGATPVGLCRSICQTLNLLITAQGQNANSLDDASAVAGSGPNLFLSGDHLGDLSPPANSSSNGTHMMVGEPTYAAAVCLLGFINTLWSLAAEALGTRFRLDGPIPLSSKIQGQNPESWQCLVKMVSSVWESLYSGCSHLLMYGSNTIKNMALVGYESLVVLSAITGCTEGRDKAITMLCKQSLPCWHGPENDYHLSGAGPLTLENSPKGHPLGSTHVAALQALMRICHLAGNHLDGKEPEDVFFSCWYFVLDCFDQLDASLSQPKAKTNASASPGHLGQQFQHPFFGDHDTTPDRPPTVSEEELAQLKQCLERFPSYTATLELRALSTITMALNTLSLNSLAFEATLLPSERKLTPEPAPPPKPQGIGDLLKPNLRGLAPKKAPPPEPTPAFSPAAQVYPGASTVVFPFTLRCLVELAMSNVSRLDSIWDMTVGHLRLVANNKAPALRTFAVDAFRDLVIFALSSLAPSNLSQKVSTRVRRLSVGVKNTGEASQEDLLQLPTLYYRKRSSSGISQMPSTTRLPIPLTFTIMPPNTKEGSAEPKLSPIKEQHSAKGMQTALLNGLREFARSPFPETQGQVLSALNEVLESCGQLLGNTGAWEEVFLLLSDVAKHNCAQAYAQNRKHSGSGDALDMPEQTINWGGPCLVLSFKSLRLIVDDFLDSVDGCFLPQLVMCMGTFGKQTADVNIAFTAVGMLWSVSDFAATRVPKDEKRPEWASHMWMNMFQELRELSTDYRPEVRNCAINTLFSMVVANGHSFDVSEWEHHLSGLIFPLLEDIETLTGQASDDADTAVAPMVKKGVKLRVHHSRDTDRKQWNETLVLALQGLERLLRWGTPWLGPMPWFRPQWKVCLLAGLTAALQGAGPGTVRSSVSAASAGLALLVTMCQLCMRNGVANIGGKKAEAGMQVVDGALQLVGHGASKEEDNASFCDSSSAEFEAVRPLLFLEAWESFREATKFSVDDEGLMTDQLVEVLAFLYRRDKTEEFSDPNRACELLAVLDSLFEPRLGTAEEGSLKKWRPKVTGYQKKILALMKEIDPFQSDVYKKALAILAKRSLPQDASLTPEFAGEALAALSSLYRSQSSLETPPSNAERARAFVQLVKVSSEPFVQGESAGPQTVLKQKAGVNVSVASTCSVVQLLTEISGSGLDVLHTLEDLDQIAEGWESLVEALSSFLLFWPSSEYHKNQSAVTSGTPEKDNNSHTLDDAEGPDDFSSCCSELLSLVLAKARENLESAKTDADVAAAAKEKIVLKLVHDLGRCTLVLTQTFLVRGWHSSVAGGECKIIRSCVSGLLGLLAWLQFPEARQRVLWSLLSVVITTCYYLPKLEKYLTISPDSQVATPDRITTTQDETLVEAAHRERLEAFTLYILEILNSLQHSEGCVPSQGFIRKIAGVVEDLMHRGNAVRSDETILSGMLDPIGASGVFLCDNKGFSKKEASDNRIVVIVLSPLLCNCILSPLERVRMLAAILLRNANIARTVLQLHNELAAVQSENEQLRKRINEIDARGNKDSSPSNPGPSKSWF